MKIVWSDFAIANLNEIFEYHKTKAGHRVARHLKSEILAATRQLNHNPESGQIEFNLKNLNKSYRYILSGNYKIMYRITVDTVLINDVFDTRQNPVKIKRNK